MICEKGKSDYFSYPINESLLAEDRIFLYREMLRIRRFEERSLRLYQQGKIGGFLHLYIGEESIAVGAASVMSREDHIITAYRDHGHALAAGMTMNECMAELLGKKTGCSKGKGGSMHFFAPDKHYWGGHGIVGGQIPLGLGIAFALKYKKTLGACLCFLGEGAVNQGVFAESLNMAALWQLPVVYIIENNRYSMGTNQKRSSAGESLAKRAEPYGIRWQTGDGSDIYEVRAKISEALIVSHKESKPSLLEFDTYRYRGHSVSDPETYRTKEEIESIKQTKDPIDNFLKILLKDNILDEKTAELIDNEAIQEAEEAAVFAENSPFPEEASILQDIYWQSDNDPDSHSLLFFE